jgi:hypothetical protein
MRVVAPEQGVADLQRRHAEHAGGDRGVGVRAQRRLRFRRIDRLGAMPSDRSNGASAASLSLRARRARSVEDRIHRFRRAARRDAGPQRGDRV